MQSVPSGREDILGTEIILETTANGIGGFFHDSWREAEKGLGDYVPVFIPWFWEKQYRRRVEPGFEFSDDNREFQRIYSLDDEQLRWSVAKRLELGFDWLYKQEYPATAAEAFQTSGEGGIISPDLVSAARILKPDLLNYGPRLGGLDPAGDNPEGDRSSFAFRQGRRVHKIESYRGKNTMELVGLSIDFIRDNTWTNCSSERRGSGRGFTIG